MKMFRRFVSLLLCAMLPLTALPAASVGVATGSINTDMLTLYGRTYVNDGILYLFWTNSGFSFRFNGTGATARMCSSNPSLHGYVHVYVDGAFSPYKTILIDNTPINVVLAENLPAGEHTIEVRKRNEADYGGSPTLGFMSLSVSGGDFLTPPAAPTRNIEFIGDSITSGFGNLGGEHFSLDYEDGTLTYAALAAKALGANASVLSRSGIGFTDANHPGNGSYANITPHYTKTATLPGNSRCATAWDFAAHKSDVVVIALGSNDESCAATQQELVDGAYSLIGLVRAKNPDAVIIWTMGMWTVSRMWTAVKTAIAELGDPNVFYYQLEVQHTSSEGVGGDGHPSAQAHVNRAIPFAEFIAEKTGWQVDASVRLQAQIRLAEIFLEKTDMTPYSKLTADAFERALASARALLKKEKVTNAEYTDAAMALWRAQNGLTKTTDCSAEYVTIDRCDDMSGFFFSSDDNVGSVDTSDYKEGRGCVACAGTDTTVSISRANAYNVNVPSDLTGWYLDCWIYADDVSQLTDKCFVQICKDNDGAGIKWTLTELGLGNGWNKLQLPLNSGTKTQISSFDQINTFRLSCRPMMEPITLKVDNIVLVHGKVAAELDDFQKAIAAAEEFLQSNERASVRAAYEFALQAVSQADVDAAVARIEKALKVQAGDVDGDGDITSTDARLVLQYYAKKIGADKLDLSAANVDGDEAVTSTDARLILQRYAKKIDKFPVE